MQCPNCGAVIDERYNVCMNCGTVIQQPENVRKPGGKKKFILIGALAAALVVALGVLAVVFLGGGTHKAGSAEADSLPSVGVFMKDDELYYYSEKEGSAVKMTSEYGIYTSVLAESLHVSPDKRYLAYPDRVDYTSRTYYSLYIRDLKKPSERAIKVASDVCGHEFAEGNSNFVFYYKNEQRKKDSDGNGRSVWDLYVYDIKKDTATKIAVEGQRFRFSEDGQNILIQNLENELYWYTVKGEKEKLAGDVKFDDWGFWGHKSNTVYYYDETRTLYVQKPGSEQKEISKTKQPVMICDKYIYFTSDEFALCYYDGKKVQIVAEKVYDIYQTFPEQGVFIGRWKDSSGESAMYRVENGKAVAFGAGSDITSYKYDRDVKHAYYVDLDSDGANYGTLYEITIMSGKERKVDEDVFSGLYYSNYAYYGTNCLIPSDMGILYYKDVDTDSLIGELYLDGKRIASDVQMKMVLYSYTYKTLYLMSDYSQGNNGGTVYTCKSGKLTKVADEVLLYDVLADGSISIWTDIDWDEEYGTVYVCHGNDRVRIADEVSMVYTRYVQ